MVSVSGSGTLRLPGLGIAALECPAIKESESSQIPADVVVRAGSALLRGFACESYRVAGVGKSPIKASTRLQEERGG